MADFPKLPSDFAERFKLPEGFAERFKLPEGFAERFRAPAGLKRIGAVPPEMVRLALEAGHGPPRLQEVFDHIKRETQELAAEEEAEEARHKAAIAKFKARHEHLATCQVWLDEELGIRKPPPPPVKQAPPLKLVPKEPTELEPVKRSRGSSVSSQIAEDEIKAHWLDGLPTASEAHQYLEDEWAHLCEKHKVSLPDHKAPSPATVARILEKLKLSETP